MQEGSSCLLGGFNDPGLSLCGRDFHWQVCQITLPNYNLWM